MSARLFTSSIDLRYKMTKENSSINFIKKLFVMILVMMVLVAGTVFVFDPFYHYHKPWLGLKAVLND